MPPKKQDTRIAVIDIGSNTFHLLICDLDYDNHSFQEVYRKREFVYLAKEGMKQLSSDKVNQAVEILCRFKEICDRLHVSTIKAIGTATLRNISNNNELLMLVNSACNIDIEIIDGQKEAELIYKGNLLGLKIKNGSMILDIGGGSVELILIQSEEVQYYFSFQIGISHLRHLFPVKNDHEEARVKAMSDYIISELTEIDTRLAQFQYNTLIGASGPFEILESLEQLSRNKEGHLIDRDTTIRWCNEVLGKNREARNKMRHMPENRSDLSLESMLIVKTVLEKISSINMVHISPYALKEGVIADLFFKSI